MKIAQVAPLAESVPPQLYGGTERMVAYLVDELVDRGHDVTLFATGDSQTTARLVAICPEGLRLSHQLRDPLALHFVMIELVARLASEFDLIHFHVAPFHFPVARRMEVPHVTTLHGRLDIADLKPFYREFADIPVVSISNAQRRPLPHANWVGTVYHGGPLDALPFRAESDGYFAFLGRISPEKRLDRAIAIAKACEYPLRIAAKVDPADANYFAREIEPLLGHPLITYVGEIGNAEKAAFLGGATALLFPIDWPEPFGLVMIEAMSCGTPIVAFRGGSVDEIIEDGVTGFVVENLDQAVDAARRVGDLDRHACRATFEHRFSVERMAADYVHLYEQAVARRAKGGNARERRGSAGQVVPGVAIAPVPIAATPPNEIAS
jgi:glycosyltransferase involved in cell wall biosynthesis